MNETWVRGAIDARGWSFAWLRQPRYLLLLLLLAGWAVGLGLWG